MRMDRDNNDIRQTANAVSIKQRKLLCAHLEKIFNKD